MLLIIIEVLFGVDDVVEGVKQQNFAGEAIEAFFVIVIVVGSMILDLPEVLVHKHDSLSEI